MQPAPPLTFCARFFHGQNTSIAVQMITTHVILELRLYAMYGRNRKILALLVFLISAEATVMGVLFGVMRPGLVGTNNPAEGVFICADGDPLDGAHWTMYYWVAVLFIESCLLSLALYQAWLHRSKSHGGGLMRALTRDSVIYFVLIFWIYLANLVLWAKNRITLNELGVSYSLVISVILANRLMIGVRSTYYQIEATLATMPSNIAFNMGHLSTFHQLTMESDTVVELEGFDVRHGY